jgi:hypothetical protein
MMDILFLIIGSFVTIICFYLIVSPFYNQKTKTSSIYQKQQDRVSVEMIYSAVNELEMDFLMKKIPEVDFQEMKERYQIMAADYFQLEDQPFYKQKETVDHSKIDHEILLELKNIRSKHRKEGRKDERDSSF